MILINPGSQIGKQEDGWTNTHAQARLNVFEWFYRPMKKQGFKDIKVTDTKEEIDGRWKFIFKHEITGVEVEAEVHGIDNLDAYVDKYIFHPRTYWNGSSSSTPKLEDFEASGFKAVMTYERNS